MSRLIEISYESDFHFWIVDYFHRLGPTKMYPKATADAADLALSLIQDCEHEEDALQQLVPKAKLCTCCGDERNHALGVVSHLVRDVEELRPYSEAVIRFLARVYRPPARTVFEETARIGFRMASLHRTDYFEEYHEGKGLRLVTTGKGCRALGVQVDLEYPLSDPFVRKPKRTIRKVARLAAPPAAQPVLRVVPSE